MMKFFKDPFGMVASLIIALILSFLMSTAAIVTNPEALAQYTIEANIRNWGTAFLTIMLTSMLLPVAMWGRKFAAACKCKPGTFAFAIVSCIIPTFFYNTFATLVLVGVNVSFSAPFYMLAVLGDWSKMFVISYIAALMVEPFAIKIAMTEYPPKHHE